MAKQMIDADNILDKIIAATFTRHAGLSEEEFLKELGIPDPQDEDSEVRKARFTLLLAITKEIFKARDRIKLMMHTLKLTDMEEKENG